MISNAVLRLKPHDNNSTNINFAQVNNGAGIGIQTTNGPGTANWDIALSPFGGNVGIGTANPDYDLDVNGDIRARENIRVFGNSVSPPTYNTPTETSVNLGTYINDFAYIDLASTNAGGSWLDFSKANGTDYSGRIRYVNSSDQFQISTAGSQKMVVTSNGNVGIGTTSPLKLLTVKKATSTNTIATSEVMRLAGTAQVVGNKNELGFANYDNDFNASVVIGAEIMSTAAYLKQDLYFATRDSTSDIAPTERMRITSGGRVEVAGNVLSIDTIDEYRQDFTTTGASTPSFDIDLKSIGASGQPFEVFVAWTHYSTSYGAGLHQAYYQRSTIQSNITLIHTYFNQTSSNGGAWSVVWLTGTEIRVQKSSGTHTGNGYGYIRVTRLKP